MKRLFKGLLALGVGLLILIVILAGVGMWFVRRPWPQVSGTVVVSELIAPVEIIRDEWGVPNIYAQNEHDLFFAQGYVHAQDRLWQMEFNRRIGNGTLSAAAGEATLDTDRFLRTIGLRRAAERDWSLMDDDTRTILEDYAAGVNAYIATHRDRLPLEFTILGLDPVPWTPIDTLAWGTCRRAERARFDQSSRSFELGDEEVSDRLSAGQAELEVPLLVALASAISVDLYSDEIGSSKKLVVELPKPLPRGFVEVV